MLQKIHTVRPLSNKSIGWKLNVAFGLLVLLTLLVVVSSAIGARRATQTINQTSDLRVPSALASVRAQTTLLEMVATVRAYLVSSDAAHLADYRNGKAAFEVTLGEMQALAQAAQNEQQLARLTQLTEQFAEWTGLSERMFALHNNPRENQPALQIYQTEVRPLSVEILGEMSVMIEMQQNRPISPQNTQLLDEMRDFQVSFESIITNLHAYAVAGDLSFRTSYMTRLPLNTATWENLRRSRSALTTEQQEKLDNIGALRERLFVWPFEILGMVEGEQAYGDLYLFRTETEPQADTMLALLDAIAAEEGQLLQDDLQAGRRGLSNAQISTVTGGILALLLAAVMAIFFREMIAGNLKRLTRTAEQIADGDLLANAKVESADEIGQLAQSFNSMTARLRDTISDLEAANHAKSRFLANMSHELRTPLNGILGYAQHLEQQSLSAEQINAVQIIQQSGNHLLTLIEDLLDLSKIEAEKLELVSADVHFPSFLEGIVGMFRLSAERKPNVQFIYEPFTPLPLIIQADAKRLRQILINLLGNAIKFTTTGTVRFRVGQISPQTFLFEVADTGIGMTGEQLSRIFKPFEQVSTAAYRGEGAGLGLAISKQLAEAMGGTLTVESAPNQGSTFRLRVEFLVLSAEVVHATQNGSITTATHAPTLTPPPPDVMQTLYDLAMKGELPRIGKQAEGIREMGYVAFADHLAELVKTFDEEGVLALVTDSC